MTAGKRDTAGQDGLLLSDVVEFTVCPCLPTIPRQCRSDPSRRGNDK